MPSAERLCLAGESAADLLVISACLQDAITRTDLIVWTPATRRVRMLCGRARAKEGAQARRVLCEVRFEHVVAARARRKPPTPAAPLELLAVSFAPEESPDAQAGEGRARLAFSGGMEMELRVAPLDVYLTDLDQEWLGPAPDRPQGAS